MCWIRWALPGCSLHDSLQHCTKTKTKHRCSHESEVHSLSGPFHTKCQLQNVSMSACFTCHISFAHYMEKWQLHTQKKWCLSLLNSLNAYLLVCIASSLPGFAVLLASSSRAVLYSLQLWETRDKCQKLHIRVLPWIMPSDTTWALP